MSDNLRNPYISGPRINQSENFYDRHELLNELINRDSRAYYLKGNRRTGKSSLLKQLHLAINQRREKEIAILLNLDGCADEKECCTFFRNALGDAAFEVDTTIFGDIKTSTNFVSLLEDTIRTAKRSGMHIYLLIDEAESLLKLPERTLARLHPHLVNLHDNLKVVLTATSQLYRLDHASQEGTPFLENFSIRHIGNLSATDSRSLILQDQLLPEERPQVAPELVMEIIRLCGGHPMWTQRLCNLLYKEGALRFPRPTDILLDRLLTNYIKTDFNNLEEEERNTLRHFNFQTAKGADEIPRECRNHIKELLNLGFILNENDKYRLSNCFLSQWLEQHDQKEVEEIAVAPPVVAPTVPKKIFLSYSKSDQTWKEKLLKQLRIFERKGQLTVWEDSRIQAGQLWREEIDKALDEADIFLFLVSADLLATDFVMDTELPAALAKQQAGQAQVIPVIMRPCAWTSSDFSNFQAVPHKGKPVSTYDNEDVALHEVVERIKKHL